VFINGVLRGNAPLTLDLDAGTYDVAAKPPRGIKSAVRKLTVEKDDIKTFTIEEAAFVETRRKRARRNWTTVLTLVAAGGGAGYYFITQGNGQPGYPAPPSPPGGLR
jgi:hypothetical protein